MAAALAVIAVELHAQGVKGLRVQLGVVAIVAWYWSVSMVPALASWRPTWSKGKYLSLRRCAIQAGAHEIEIVQQSIHFYYGSIALPVFDVCGRRPWGSPSRQQEDRSEHC